jgi:hypothetical protein
MSNKISGGTNISPLISSMILLSARLSMDKRKLMTDSIKLSTKAPKKILLKTVNILTYKKPPVKPEPVKKVKSTKKSKSKKGKKPVTVKSKKPVKKTKSKKMKGGGRQDFFE